MTRRAVLDRKHPWLAERDALARAVGGALLFGVPLLFTMEMWWIGESIHPVQLVAFLAVAFVANIVLARMSGFRSGTQNWAGDVAQACESMAIGVVISLIVLAALGRIGVGDPFVSVIGIVAIQVVPLSLGAMVANLVFDPDVGRANDGGKVSDDENPWKELRSDVVATAAGAMFVGFAIAPTEEVPMLAAGLTLPTQLALLALALGAGYVIVFASGFDPMHRGKRVGGLFQHPFSETVLAFVISLACAMGLLLCFGQIALDDPFRTILLQSLVLAVPASIGGAAGRVVV